MNLILKNTDICDSQWDLLLGVSAQDDLMDVSGFKKKTQNKTDQQWFGKVRWAIF